MGKLGRAILGLFVAVSVLLTGVFVRLTARRYQRLRTLCIVACSLECWIKITQGKPIDLDSSLLKQIHESIAHYFAQATKLRDEVGPLERAILPQNYYLWVLRDRDDGDIGEHYRFARDNGIASIINYYVNIERYIILCATVKVSSLEKRLNLKSSAAFWRPRVAMDELPTPLQKGISARSVRSYLTKKVSELKSDLARRNYTKIDVAPSDLTAFITLTGTLLLLLGYLRISAISSYFGIPYHRYFSSSDYIANSVAAVDKVLLAAVAATILASFNFATMNAYALPSETMPKPFLDRLAYWSWHFVGLSSLAALLVSYYTYVFEPGVLFIAIVYMSVLVVADLSAKFFIRPEKAYLFIMFIIISVAGSVTSVIREIQALSRPASGPRRTIEFTKETYLEPEWRVLAITNNFVLLRRQSDGLIQVHAKSDLKRIDDVPDPPVPSDKEKQESAQPE